MLQSKKIDYSVTQVNLSSKCVANHDNFRSSFYPLYCHTLPWSSQALFILYSESPGQSSSRVCGERGWAGHVWGMWRSQTHWLNEERCSAVRKQLSPLDLRRPQVCFTIKNHASLYLTPCLLINTYGTCLWKYSWVCDCMFMSLSFSHLLRQLLTLSHVCDLL